MTNDLLFFALLFGYLLDLILGDPEKLPHPIRFFGNIISSSQKFLNNGQFRRAKGILLAITLPVLTFYSFYEIERLLIIYAPSSLAITYATIIIFFGLANKSLITEGRNVLKGLNIGLDEGRKKLSRIVGRDTNSLNEQEIKISVLETLSENLSDGVIAPLFFLLVGGIPGMMAYKMVNTLDSMVGYKTKRYLEFGWGSAKLDDVLNFIPARITAILIAIVSFKILSFKFIWKFGSAHASPNSGYPEAALAGALNCKFGGPNYYHGELINKPSIGINEKQIPNKDLYYTFKINHVVTLLTVLALLIYFATSSDLMSVFYGY